MNKKNDSQYPHLYMLSEQIENDRMKNDLLYNVLMNPDTTAMDGIVEEFVSNIDKQYTDKSKRMVHVQTTITTDPNRLLKHSFIFFALHQEPWAMAYFMKNNACPPDKLSNFVAGELKKCCEQLLKGSYTSMQAFVEDVRWNYVVL